MTDADYSAKICAVCKQEYPLDRFHKDKSKRDGHVSTCKECAKERARTWFKDNRERGIEKRRAHYRKNHKAALAHMREYRAKNAEACRKAVRNWVKKNPDRKAELDRKWHGENPEKMRRYRVVSEARRRKASGSFTAVDIERLLVAQGHKCAICKTSVKKKRHVDHIVPLSKGGENTARNLQILCPKCNVRKHAKDPITHMRELGFLI